MTDSSVFGYWVTGCTALQSVSEGRQGGESEGRLVDVGRKGFIYVCILYTRGVADYIVAERGRWRWRWYALFIGAGGLISTETFIVQLRRTFVSLHGFSFRTIIFVVCIPIYIYVYLRTGSRVVHNIAFMVCQSPASILIASRKIQLRSTEIRAARHARRTVPSRRTERTRERERRYNKDNNYNSRYRK